MHSYFITSKFLLQLFAFYSSLHEPAKFQNMTKFLNGGGNLQGNMPHKGQKRGTNFRRGEANFQRGEEQFTCHTVINGSGEI